MSDLNQCYRKKRYSDSEFAERVARQCKEQRGVALRAYFCPVCSGFHLTKNREAQGTSVSRGIA